MLQLTAPECKSQACHTDQSLHRRASESCGQSCYPIFVARRAIQEGFGVS